MFARHAGPAALLLAAAALGIGCTSNHEKTSPIDGWTLQGSKQGQSAALVDWDGDGIPDKAVGAPYATAASGSLGAVLVYAGRENGFATQPTAVLAGDDNFGFSVADVGDVDGDGRSDFAVAAIGGDGEGASLCGSVTIFRGGTRGATLVKLAGEVPLAKFGYAIAAGDLDGDGHRDLVVGAPFHTEDPALYQAGAVHVFFGPDLARSVKLSATAGVQGLGWSVAVGDLDGDGRADLVVGAAGKVIGFYGSTPFAPSFAAPDVVVGGSAGSLGRGLAVVGDVDGDGVPELAIGAPGAAFGGGRDSGSLYLVRGGAGPRSVNLDAIPADPSLLARIDASGAFQRFGASVVAVADLDGDGRADLAVGAPLADVPGMPLAGRVYLFRGKDLGPGASLASATVFGGVSKSRGFGSSLWPCAGGRLLIGAPRADADTGGVAMVDLATGLPVPGGGSGGADGGGVGDCH